MSSNANAANHNLVAMRSQNENGSPCVWANLPDNEIIGTISARKQIKATYSPDGSTPRTIVIHQKQGSTFEPILRFDKLSTKAILDFLQFIASTDLPKIIDGTQIPMNTNSSLNVHIDPEKVKKYLGEHPKEGDEILDFILNSENIEREIVNIGYRQRQLRWFEDMLNGERKWEEYAQKFDLKTNNEEVCWQKFFEKNPWIFGYGLSYRYLGVLQGQRSLEDGYSPGPITDFAMADSRFITFVEIKKPSTQIWNQTDIRAGTWSLTNHLLEAYSQILGQKFAGDQKFGPGGFDIEDNDTSLRAIDSKCILVIGKLSQIPITDSDKVRKIKERTFELFRRDSRNIEIITYDELYDRAKFIVDNSGYTGRASR